MPSYASDLHLYNKDRSVIRMPRFEKGMVSLETCYFPTPKTRNMDIQPTESSKDGFQAEDARFATRKMDLPFSNEEQ